MAREQLGGGQADLAVLFCSSHHARHADQLATEACDLLSTDKLLGCTGEAIVGASREIEHDPALSLWLAQLPGVNTSLFRLEFERTREGGVIQGWPDELAGDWAPGTFLLMLGEPFSFPADLLIDRLNEDRPGVPVIGGMASGGHEPGTNRLFFGRQTLAEGAVAALVSGNVRVRTVVSQGCRPIGRHFVVTKAERNVIYELGGKPALIQLKEIFDSLPTREQLLVQRALHVGRVVSEYQERFEQGDFLVRNVTGLDPGSARSPSVTTSAPARPCSSTFAIRKRPTPSSSSFWPRPARPRPARPADCSSPATAAARGCSASRITTPKRSPRPSARCLSPASSPRGRSARSAGRTSCTDSRPAWLCSKQ